MKAHEKLIS